MNKTIVNTFYNLKKKLIKLLNFLNHIFFKFKKDIFFKKTSSAKKDIFLEKTFSDKSSSFENFYKSLIVYQEKYSLIIYQERHLLIDFNSFWLKYISLNANSFNLLKDKSKKALKKRLNNLIKKVNKYYLSANQSSLLVTTLTSKYLSHLLKVKKEAEILFKELSKKYSENDFTFLVLPELHQCSLQCHWKNYIHNTRECHCIERHRRCERLWHLPILHSTEINITSLWEIGNITHIQRVIKLDKKLCYLLKDWPYYYYNPRLFFNFGVNTRKNFHFLFNSLDNVLIKEKKRKFSYNPNYYQTNKKDIQKRNKDNFRKKRNTLLRQKNRLLQKIKKSNRETVLTMKQKLDKILQKIREEN